MKATEQSIGHLLEVLVQACVGEEVFVETEEGLLLLSEDRERVIQGIKNTTKWVSGKDVPVSVVIEVLKQLEQGTKQAIPM